ncbi:MAG: FAD-binding oxidoreductase [Candidatus Dadabacteria bacterium]|nr:MAG: FAD-binding oxidoreductase [Candidatus Dadabacteria bacterium]
MLKEKLVNLLSPTQVTDEPSELQHYGQDWIDDYKANPSLVVFPESIEQVQKVINFCRSNKIALVPSGGRTGMSAGATATSGECVLSLERLRKIVEVSKVDRSITCQAGVVTEVAQQAAAAEGLYLPLDFGARASSTIGGNIATNVGGLHVIRYGNIRQWVLGLKVVTASGELLTLNGKLYKNQTGPDLTSIFIGSEGILGVIVEATLKLTRPPGDSLRMLCGISNLNAALSLLVSAREAFREITSFEFFTDRCLKQVIAHSELRQPFSEMYDFYLVIEAETAAKDAEKWLAKNLEDGTVKNALISHSSVQYEEFMKYRELIPELVHASHTVHKNDVSVAISDVPAFYGDLTATFKQYYPSYEVLIFGHIGDGNLHIEVIKPEELPEQEFINECKQVDHHIFSVVKKYHGSISAEHGVGLLKRDYLHYTRTEAEINYLRKLKSIFDPDNILNPGKVIPA